MDEMKITGSVRERPVGWENVARMVTQVTTPGNASVTVALAKSRRQLRIFTLSWVRVPGHSKGNVTARTGRLGGGGEIAWGLPGTRWAAR